MMLYRPRTYCSINSGPCINADDAIFSGTENLDQYHFQAVLDAIELREKNSKNNRNTITEKPL